MPHNLVPPPRVHRLHGGTPLLERDPGHLWENRVTFNPACARVTDRAAREALLSAFLLTAEQRAALGREEDLVALLYRAQGNPTPAYDYTRSCIGLALLAGDLRLLGRRAEPLLKPETASENLGVEDGRVTRTEQGYVLFYAAYSSQTGGNQIRIAFATSDNLVHWRKQGLLDGDFNQLDNKNAMLWEGKPDGRYLILHRPMRGKDAMAIHWAESSGLGAAWHSRGMLIPPLPNPEFADTWVGGGAPPLLLDDHRYLILYHIGNRRADGTREYDLGLALADLRHPDLIVKRSEPLLRPETDAERFGDPALGVNNVAFVCGAYFRNGDLVFPYAGADSVVLGAKVADRDLRAWIG